MSGAARAVAESANIGLAPFLTVVASLAGGAIGAWAAATFSNRNFHLQQLWQRRAEAYSVIFEALYEMEQWYEVHLADIANDKDTTEEKSAKLRESYQRGREKLGTTLARETWIVSDEIRIRLERIDRELEASPNEMWHEVVENGAVAMRKATADLRDLVRRELLTHRLT